jgi:hypothetical protein
VNKFRKKPVVITAVQFTQAVRDANIFDGGDLPEGVIRGRANYHTGRREVYDARYFVETLEGRMEVSLNDWIITGVKGEIYPCKPDIFAATYEPASAAPVKESAPTADYDMDHRDLARRIMVFMGRATTGSNEPGADPLADRLAAKLAEWRALAAASQAQAEPVAWRYRMKGGKHWQVTASAEMAGTMAGHANIEVRPLVDVAAPSAASSDARDAALNQRSLFDAWQKKQDWERSNTAEDWEVWQACAAANRAALSAPAAGEADK